MIQRKINQELLHSYSDEVPRFLKPIYAGRGIYEEELDLHISCLLTPDFADLHTAHKILTKAIIEQQKIIIVADFDADGATSCALAISALRAFGSTNVDFIVPNRFIHGYGLSKAIVDIAKEKNAEIIITVDNGISSFEGVEYAKNKNMKVIITDHHLPSNTLPKADAIINPNLKNCSFPSKNLAGVGVAFYLFSSLKTYLKSIKHFNSHDISKVSIKQFLDFVALGTIADVVPLDRNNKILVNEGLKIIRSGNCSKGILALLDISKKSYETITATDLAFSIAPKINASGRMNDISRGIKCLLSIDYHACYAYAVELNDFNNLRKDTQKQMSDDADKILSQIHIENNFSICLFDPSWHEGIVGIVAGKCKEQYGKPSFIFARSRDMLKGSARSIPKVHIKDLLDIIDRDNPKLIDKFGGHSMAAGLTIYPENFTHFSEIFEKYVCKHLKNILPTNYLVIDGELDEEDINHNHAQILESLIWGNASEEPIFHNTFVIIEQKVIGEEHLRLRLKHTYKVFDAVAFFTTPLSSKRVQIAYTLNINRFNKQETMQLICKEINELQ